MSTIVARPFEEEALFNAAFVSVLLSEAAKQYDEKSGRHAMPVILPYLVAPLALHRPTREKLPARVTAQMGEWVRAHPELLVDLGDRARSLRPLVSAGVCFGLTAAFMKEMTGTLSKGLVPVLTSWPIYAMAGAGLTGMFLVQNALQAGKLVAAQPGISLLDPFTSIAWGVLAFHERTRGGALLVVAGAAAAAMALGAVLLSRSPVLQRSQAEEGGAQERGAQVAPARAADKATT